MVPRGGLLILLILNFKHYLFGTEFTLQTDHRALLMAINENRGSKTYQNRQTRLVDRLLTFNFNL